MLWSHVRRTRQKKLRKRRFVQLTESIEPIECTIVVGSAGWDTGSATDHRISDKQNDKQLALDDCRRVVFPTQ